VVGERGRRRGRWPSSPGPSWSVGFRSSPWPQSDRSAGRAVSEQFLQLSSASSTQPLRHPTSWPLNALKSRHSRGHREVRSVRGQFHRSSSSASSRGWATSTVFSTRWSTRSLTRTSDAPSAAFSDWTATARAPTPGPRRPAVADRRPRRRAAETSSEAASRVGSLSALGRQPSRSNAAVTTTIQLRFDRAATIRRLSLRPYRHRDLNKSVGHRDCGSAGADVLRHCGINDLSRTAVGSKWNRGCNNRIMHATRLRFDGATTTRNVLRPFDDYDKNDMLISAAVAECSADSRK